MNCLLVTGVTGMLGHFLLRDWLLADQRIAVIARDQRLVSARQRVDQIISGWEETLQRFLPRPVVLAGDIQQPMLGLSSADANWVARNCDSILHSAASVKFYADESENRLRAEPYLSNVVGTRNVLDFCRQTGIVNFHHVSTAYVCGQQAGPVWEQPIGAARFGNDYEASKAEAENLVRQASYLKSKTFLRPAIIVGDSNTGYTPAFHGIYTALQLGYLFVIGIIRSGITDFTPESIDALIKKQFIESLGLQGNEQKNLVPADWVSAVIFRVVRDSKLHNRTYHITNPQPVPLSAIIASMRDAVLSYLPQIANETSGVPGDLLASEGFRSLMDTYRAYFCDDPKFDSTHTQTLPSVELCPDLDHETLVKLWRFAIEAEFSPKKNSASPVVPWDVEHLLSEAFDRSSRHERDRAAVWAILQVNGPGGGNWRIGFEKKDARLVPSMFERADLGSETALRFQINSRGLAALLKGELNVEESFYGGELFAQTSELKEYELQMLAQQLFTALQVASRANSNGKSSEATHSAFSQQQRPAAKGTSL